MLSHLVADAINCEFQAGGDAATLERIAVALSCYIEHEPERERFFDIASAGGLLVEYSPLWRSAPDAD